MTGPIEVGSFFLPCDASWLSEDGKPLEASIFSPPAILDGAFAGLLFGLLRAVLPVGSGPEPGRLSVSFAAPATVDGETVTFTLSPIATGGLAPYQYQITLTPVAPLPSSPLWGPSPADYTAPGFGVLTLYAWVMDSAGSMASAHTDVEFVNVVLPLSTIFSTALYGSDYADSATAPTVLGGSSLLYCLWQRVVDVGTPPATRGNMEVFQLNGTQWYLRCIVANGDGSGKYNANSMLFATTADTYIGDYSYYDLVRTIAEFEGWVWSAWQVAVDTVASTFIIRQYLRFGTSGAVFLSAESIIPWDDIRALLEAAGWTHSDAYAWTPGESVSFSVGSGQPDSSGYYAYARAYSIPATAPLVTSLDTIAEDPNADPTAWGDWSLLWSGGASAIADRTANARDLTLHAGGTLYEGIAAPL